ncbi:UNVERIFIED_ORG: hypothetical protein ABID33_003334 [Xanthobacter viscosus]|uniref:Uncharacterized protein n=1 Tax=Xanthobacter autotrophicus TaxID=280 RepID=A0A6C1KKD7_XANAU|nr:hypothetical protein [Xanthobacter autotrophicus]TLX44788.1 hypothetical protein FBQ73_01700 [Xanthobacter autotrophicus]
MNSEEIATYISTLGTTVSILFSGWAALAASRAAKSASEQAEITRKQLISDQRAWILNEVLNIEDFSFNEKSISMTFNVKISNIGRTPALDVTTYVKLLDYKNSTIPLIEDFVKSLCYEEPYSSRLVMPGDTYVRTWCPSFELVDSDSNQMFALIAIVCCTYKTLHDDNFHQTVRTFMLSKFEKQSVLFDKDTISSDITISNHGYGRAT